MPSYVVTLDVMQQETLHDRDLVSELERLHGHRVTLHTWLVDVRQNHSDLEKHLSRYLKTGDKVRAEALRLNHRVNMETGYTAEWIRRHPPLPSNCKSKGTSGE